MNEVSATQIVVDVIQRVYGDASQTTLDRTAAREIIAALRERGWASLDEVALLIESAGGSITIPDDLVRMNPVERVVERSDDFAARGTRFTVRSKV